MKNILYLIFTILAINSALNLQADGTEESAVYPPNCNAQFSATPDSVNSLLIYFTDNSTGNPTVWNWDFGDGTSSINKNPTHTYASAGNYAVTLTISDSNSFCSDSITQVISVAANNPCYANFSHTANSNNNLQISFTDLSTGNPNAWAWNFGDGSSSNTQNPSHIYAQAGTYTVSLKITSQNCSDSINQQITVTVNNISGSLLVYAFADSSYLNNAMLYLYQYDSLSGSIEAVDSTGATTNQGITYYNFANIPLGYYKVYAKILNSSSMYGLFYDTWMPNTIYWQTADSILVNSNSIYTYIQMAKSNVSYPVGNSHIKGVIKTKNSNGYLPLANVPIYLLLNDSNIISRTFSDQQGAYQFNNLAYGTYYIHPEIIGKTIQNRKVVLNVNTPNADSASFEVDGHRVIAGISPQANPLSTIKLYPNPVSNYIFIDFEKEVNLIIEILDIQGRILLTRRWDNISKKRKNINISQLHKGLYFINIQFKNYRITKKFIKH